MADYGKLPYKVADISLADFGRKELNLAEARTIMTIEMIVLPARAPT